MGGAHMGERRSAYRILTGKPEGTRTLGRPRSRWENNFKIHLKEILWEGVDWIDLAQDRAIDSCCEYGDEY
jgi:hypothetical protein